MTVHVERSGRVAVLTLDRPERRNALDEQACDALADAVAAVAGGPEPARAIVLAGAGPHFCAGADLTGIESGAFARVLRRALEALAFAPMPTIAAVQGAALGAGMQLAIACDLRVAGATARFGIPAAKLGLMVDHWTMQRLALTAGHGPARAMLLAAEELDGRAAHGLGLVHRLAGGDDAVAVGEAARSWAADIAELAPLTVAGHKIGLNGLEQPRNDDDADPAVTAAFQAAWESADLVEGMSARAERRPPRFEGR